VNRYFRKYRVDLASALGEERLKPLDREMQDLLRCAQRRTETRQYVQLVRACQKELNRLETGAVTLVRRHDDFALDPREQLILETLQKLVKPSAARCLEQGLTDLARSDRKSWRGTILEFREALRETLDYLAPDEEVMKNPSFKPEPNLKRPSMAQKVVFILGSRGLNRSQMAPAATAMRGVEEMVGRLVRQVYNRASAGVHTEVQRAEALQVKNWVLTVLAELLEVGR
jgi:hypothetical protein